MKHIKQLTLTLLLMSCLTMVLHAQNADNPWSFGISTGKNAYNGSLGNTIFDGDQPYQAFGGVHINRCITPRLDLSLEGTYGCLGIFEWNRDAFVNNMTNVDLSALYKLGGVGSKFQPFLHAGLGINSHVAMMEGRGPVESITNFGVPVGLGIRLGLGSAADLFWKATYGLNFGNDYDLHTETDGNDHFLQNALGIQFNFGPSKAGAVVKIDTDGDGIFDSKDKCPNIAGIKQFDGCPMSEADMAAKAAAEAEAKLKAEMEAKAAAEERARIRAEKEAAARLEAEKREAARLKAQAEAKAKAEAEAKAAAKVETKTTTTTTKTEVVTKTSNDGKTYTGATGRGVISRSGTTTTQAETRGYEKDDRSYETRTETYAEGYQEGRVVTGTTTTTRTTTSAYPDLQELFRRARYEVKFNTGSATLSSASYGILNEIVAKLKSYGNIAITIEGHTDSQGSETSNLTLSRNRAQAVLDYLATKGVSRSLLSSSGFGETYPIGDNATSEGRRQNRRVEIRIR